MQISRRRNKIVNVLIIGCFVWSFLFSPLTQIWGQEASTTTESIATSPIIETEQEENITSETSTEVLAQNENSTSSESSTSTISEDNAINSATTSNVLEQPAQEENLEPPEQETSTAVVIPSKFKKNTSQSIEEQLSTVRKHLENNNLTTAISRLDVYEAQQAEGPKEKGIIRNIIDFFTGNTDAKKEKKKIEELSKKQPFKVDTYDGTINKRNIDSYETLFSNAKEQGNLWQKIKNLWNNGTLYNSNFDKTQKNGPISRIFVDQINAQVSQDPNDYLSSGNEIIFSQAIQDQADELNNDPLTILNFVRNNIKYTPYYGSKKGSDATLIEREGNDMDQASLLIAMLRYSSIPARYRHIDAQMDIETVTGLLGVNSAIAAAQVLSLNDIPYILFTDNEDNPLFFVVEHTYVEAYIPYGYSRGVDINDGGESQWVPMDPTVIEYNYDQDTDIIEGMNQAGFNIEDFFDNYFDNDFGTSTEPLDAFKIEVENYLASTTPTSTYAEALMRFYSTEGNNDFISGSLPYYIAADLSTYDYIPSTLRHTIEFTLEDSEEEEILNYTSYVSDLADRELLVTFQSATEDDQDIIDTFDTIYDVVPLSLVAVYTNIKVGGETIATSTATTTLGQPQSYNMEFSAPTRVIGSVVDSEVKDNINRDIITGNTDAIALDTGKIVPSEIRPNEDTATNSFFANQMLYKTGLDYLYRLEEVDDELANIIGGDFTDIATRATIFNGIEMTYDQGIPYSFDWIGLRIDSSAKVNYFNRLNADTTIHLKEFAGIFGLQGSQDESNIFEDNFGVESIATVKGLKLVSGGEFQGVTLHKITSANENDIDSLSVSTTTKTIFHDAVSEGRTIYTPSSPVTYGQWNGLFYVSIDFNEGIAGYIIGEGLNGGYTVEEYPSGMSHLLRTLAANSLGAQIISPSNGGEYQYGQSIYWEAEYLSEAPFYSWTESTYIPASQFYPGTTTLRTGYGTNASVAINILEADIDMCYLESAWVHDLDDDRFASVIEQIQDIMLEDGEIYWPEVAGAIAELDEFEKGVLLENTVSLAGSILPVLGEASDAYALFLKEDMFTEQELSSLQQTISGLALFIPFLGSKAIRMSKPVMAAVRLGAKGEDAVKVIIDFEQGVDEAHKVFKVAYKGAKTSRIVDAFKSTSKVAVESKVGRVSATTFVKAQIDKDIILLRENTETVENIRWVFLKSGITKKAGPTPGLVKYKDEQLLLNNISPDKFIFDTDYINQTINP
jgi:hypothetical protein